LIFLSHQIFLSLVLAGNLPAHPDATASPSCQVASYLPISCLTSMASTITLQLHVELCMHAALPISLPTLILLKRLCISPLDVTARICWCRQYQAVVAEISKRGPFVRVVDSMVVHALACFATTNIVALQQAMIGRGATQVCLYCWPDQYEGCKCRCGLGVMVSSIYWTFESSTFVCSAPISQFCGGGGEPKS